MPAPNYVSHVILFLALFAVHSIAATTRVDVYLDMESGTSGSLVTSALLNAATHGAGGSWATVPGTLSAMHVTTGFEPTLGTQILVGDTLYTDATSSRGYAFRNVTDREFARYTFETTHPRVSFGCFLRIGDFDGSTFGSYDLVALEGDGEFIVLNFQDFPGDGFAWQIHTQAGTHDPFPIKANTTYWATLLWDQPNRRAFLKAYDAETWELVGSASIPLLNEPCEAVCFGRYDDHDKTTDKFHDYDDLMIDYSTAEFPILPSRIGPAREPLFLSVAGEGTINGATNTQLLNVGRQYTITARPEAGYLFAGWTGSTSTLTANLKFVMTSNLTFTANFVPNPYLNLAGTYVGLFRSEAQPEQRSSGYLQLSLGSSGAYSAKMMLNGKSQSAAGTLTFDGSGEAIFKRPHTNAIFATFQIDLNDPSDQIEGSLVEQPINDIPLWASTFVLNRAGPAAAEPGRYTFCILPASNAPSSPQGNGFGTLNLSSKAAVNCSGSLADGTKFSQGTFVDTAGDWPFYTSLYAGKGAFFAAVKIDPGLPSGDLEGTVSWIKQAQSAAKIYPDGFTNTTRLLGSHYLPPSATQRLLEITNGSIEFSFDNLATAFANEIEISPENKIDNQGANRLSISVSKTSGRFSGATTPPSTSKALSFSGVVLQRQNLGAGFFISTNHSGNVILGP